MTETTELELQAPDSERALIGTAGYYPDALAAVLERLPGEDFYDLIRGQVWDTCRKLSADHEPITPMTVAKRMTADGTWSKRAQTIVQTEMSTASPVGHAARHADVIGDLARRRELLRAVNVARAMVVQHSDVSEVLPKIRAHFENLGRTVAEAGSGPRSWDALIADWRIAHGPDAAQARAYTPWEDLNDLLGGLFGGRMYVFGGRPAMGKSTAALNIAMRAATQQRQTLVVSREMPNVDVIGRVLASGAEAPLWEINARRMTPATRQKINDYIEGVGRPALTVDDRTRSVAGIRHLARAHHHRHGLDVLVVDYLQLVDTDKGGRSRQEEVAEVSRQMKSLALELDIVVILPAQLNRESTKRADPTPTLADLRDSGQIEQDADVVILLHRPDAIKRDDPRAGEIDLIVAKNRHGPTTTVTCGWSGGYGYIGDLRSPA